MLLENRTAIVTGAGSPAGIGHATARAFVDAGARVVLVDLDPGGVAEAAAMLGERAVGIAANVRSPETSRHVFDHVRQTAGRLDILVNSAGITQARRTLDITPEDYEAVMSVNLGGTLVMIQQALPMMTAGGSIVCIASIAGQRGGGLMGGPHYAASKGGVASLVKSVAREVAGEGIRVNSVNPGVIMSQMTRDFYDEANTARVLPNIPLARFGEPSEVASVCLFLASDMASYLTGTSIDVNGGMHMN